jgi:putative drug exporter of the RND superfamily
MPALHLNSGPRAGERIELDRELIIGRHGADVIIDDATLSRRHLAVRPLADAIELEDLGSFNGTLLDGRPIHRPTLAGHGATVKLGETTFQVDLGGSRDATLLSADHAAMPIGVTRVSPRAPSQRPHVGTTRAGRRPLVARLAGASIARRRIVVAAWVLLLAAVIASSRGVGTHFVNNFALPGTESQHAADLLKRDFPTQAGDADQIVFSVRSGSVSDRPVRAVVASVLASVARLPHVTGVVSPYSTAGARGLAPGGEIAFATVTFDERAQTLPKAAVRRVISVARAGRSVQVDVELGGQAIEQVQPKALGRATAVGLLGAVVVLLITFGSFAAMALPIVTALLGVGVALGVAGLASHVIQTPDFATALAAMIGLGVGIDYALFIVTRFRSSHEAGSDVQRATLVAMETAGRAVLFAGVTVIIALLGQFLLGVSFIYGLAWSSALAVLFTMLAALSALPAVLSRLGKRVASRRGAGRAGAEAISGGWWGRWASFIQRHSWQGAIAGLAIMLTLAVPALSLRLGTSDAHNDPTSQTTRHAYDLLAKGFGHGFNGPLLVVATSPPPASAAVLSSISTSLRATPDVASVSPPRLSPQAGTAVFDVYPRSAPQDAASSDLVDRLRQNVLPSVARSTKATILVGGSSATTIDFTRVLSGRIPLFVGAVVAFSALLLLVVFRSLVIPSQAALLNLLSISASLGVAVAVFQWGWLGSVLGIEKGPIESFIPVALFAIVFGLSMDYEVFLVSRIREEWSTSGDAAGALRTGVASTGRVITAAALIMICVFVSFVLAEQRVLKLFGLTLASAVLLDAFVVRSLLLPSLLQLSGRHVWALPNRLGRWLPLLAIHGHPVDHSDGPLGPVPPRRR